MTAPAIREALVITLLDLSDLRTCRHGIYQRFRAILTAATQRFSIVSLVVYAPDSAGDIRSYGEHITDNIQSEWNLAVRTVVLSPAPLPRVPWLLLQIAGALSYRLSPTFLRYLHRQNAEIIASVAHSGVVACIIHRLPSMEFVLHIPAVRRLPILFDMDDVEHMSAARIAGIATTFRQRLMTTFSVAAIKRAERRSISAASMTLVCSESDAMQLRSLGPGSVSVLNNSIELPARESVVASKRHPAMIMVGAYSYGPNADGAVWFLSEIWPVIRRTRPDVTAVFVGKGSESIPDEFRSIPGVQFRGFVDDIAAAYSDSAIAICPLRAGGGTRIKILEAAAYGLPTVSTTIGAEGIPFVDGVHIAIADTVDSFAAQCLLLLDDADLARSIGSAARTVVEQTFSRSSQLEHLCELMDALSARPPKTREQIYGVRGSMLDG